jgi:amino acid transporter
MAFTLAILTAGIAYYAHYYGILPNEKETVLSQLARTIFSKGPVYYTIQFATALILILAANTSYSDFPRLSSIMANDRYLPRQLSNRGDKLVFSTGILILGFLSALLLVLFRGETHLLIPLYAVGVFTAFTLSQTGMVKHWIKDRRKGWLKSAFLNGIGALVTGVVLVIIAVEKFSHGMDNPHRYPHTRPPDAEGAPALSFRCGAVVARKVHHGRNRVSAPFGDYPDLRDSAGGRSCHQICEGAVR